MKTFFPSLLNAKPSGPASASTPASTIIETLVEVSMLEMSKGVARHLIIDLEDY